MIGRLSDVVFVHSHSAIEPVARQFDLPRERIHVVPHPRYTAPEAGAATRAEARQNLGMDEGVTTFAFVGNVRPYKGVEELLDAFGRVDDADCRLHVIGGPIDETYGRRIAELISRDPRAAARLERVEDRLLHDALLAADAVVLPYRSILTSGALVLAMSAGRAVIGPRMGVFAEHIGAEGGLLYEAGDTESLAAALCRALGDRAQLDRMGERNRRLAEQWSPDAVGAETMRVLAEARRTRSRPGHAVNRG
jgi:glycosyltransferase involved in cell wall biosynthesis